MHEAAIAQAIIDQLLEKATEGVFRGKLELVRLKVGKFTAIVPDNLIFLYEVLSADTLIARSQLEIEMIPVWAKCRNCCTEFEVADLEFWCPMCSSTSIEITTGRELLINTLEVSDDD
jgi:hydrogenase nickel incorporation protein HypA/HybF